MAAIKPFKPSTGFWSQKLMFCPLAGVIVKDRGAAVETAGAPLTLREGEVREGEPPAESPPLTVEPAEPEPAHVYDDPAHTPDFDALRESFQQGKIVIRVEPKREGPS